VPSKSKQQQKFMGLVHAYKKGEVPASKVSKAVKDAAKSMSKKSVKKYAKTKHDDLPKKVGEDKVDKTKFENILKENPIVMAATHGAMDALKKQQKKVPGKGGKPIAMTTALKDKTQPSHNKVKDYFKKLVAKFIKSKKKPEKQKQSKKDIDFYKKQFGVKESLQENLISFYKYMGDFYGKKGIYPDKKGRDLKVGDINKALSVYLKKYAKDTFTGDSLDRERVRDILIKMKKIDPQYKKQEVRESNIEQMVRKVIKEEVQNLLNEGTRWLVGIEQPNGKITSTYGHYDGYPEWAGKHLKKYYNNPMKAKELLKLGKSGISTIGPKIKGSKDHSFDKPDKGVTVFYGRDRGEKSRMTSNWKNRDAVKFESGEEYAYIYNLKEKKWYYKSRYSNPQDWTELK
tara:strand:+ start:1638 stop:2840 length:1203 start_codon:yes stop_codon:yes gene_type:complete